MGLRFPIYRRERKTTYPQVSVRIKLADNEGEHIIRNSPWRAEVATDRVSNKDAGPDTVQRLATDKPHFQKLAVQGGRVERDNWSLMPQGPIWGDIHRACTWGVKGSRPHTRDEMDGLPSGR